jgi:MoaA/NifB/PqqE/SkfB family radical SAM enzyme
VGCRGVDWAELAHDGVKRRDSVVDGFHKSGEIFEQLRNFQFLKQGCTRGSYFQLSLVGKCFYAVHDVNVS